MAKYKLSSMRWEFAILDIGSLRYRTVIRYPLADEWPRMLPVIATRGKTEKAIHSFCRVNGIKSYGITE